MIRRSTLLAALVVPIVLAGRASAGQETVRIGGATIQFDTSHWKAEADSHSVYFSPKGETAEDLDPVEVHMLAKDNATSCADISTQHFYTGRYDTSKIERSEVTIAGLKGERFAAHTQCRNATPMGEIICVQTGGATYLLAALQVGCGGRNLFSGIDPLTEIAGGVRFGP